MKNKKLILLFASILFSVRSFSQCSMCKAAVEANLKAGDNKGAGLNDGILYLMSVPYIAVLVFGLFWYFQHKKQNA